MCRHQTPLYKQSSAPVESRVKDLLGRMTVDEKIGQLCCPLGWEMYTKTSKGVVPSELYKERMSAAPIGSFWAVLRADPWTQKTLETGLNSPIRCKSIECITEICHRQYSLGNSHSLCRRMSTRSYGHRYYRLSHFIGTSQHMG